jgi:hypothetical protein
MIENTYFLKESPRHPFCYQYLPTHAISKYKTVRRREWTARWTARCNDEGKHTKKAVVQRKAALSVTYPIVDWPADVTITHL